MAEKILPIHNSLALLTDVEALFVHRLERALDPSKDGERTYRQPTSVLYERLVEEQDELAKELEKDQSGMEEIADVAIFLLGVARTLDVDISTTLPADLRTRNPQSFDNTFHEGEEPTIDQLQDYYASQTASSVPKVSQDIFENLHTHVRLLGDSLIEDDRPMQTATINEIFLACMDMATLNNLSLAEVVSHKLARNNDKYDPNVINHLYRRGLVTSPAEALQLMKDTWRSDYNYVYGLSDI